MGVVDGFKSASLFAKISFVLLVVAALFASIAFTCTGWAKNNVGAHYGLWRLCGENVYAPGCTQLDGWAVDWWAATQALVSFGFFGIWVALILVSLVMFSESFKGNKEMAIAAAIVCIVTGVLYLIGVIVFGAEFDKYFISRNYLTLMNYSLSYCFGLSIVALVFEIVAGVLMILDGKGGGGGTKPSA
ncbi:hypothetical protein CHS0354_042519 [Potamilus streckersoni]|uniref:Uncharacterized protein n=1 Tax=Potamilus streckersoni TaxID=2493646 RepID=A0AAE0TDR5_9BIVA|nr:hypothetical protein CHS0354_042519 [Potamilus streckersoni]